MSAVQAPNATGVDGHVRNRILEAINASSPALLELSHSLHAEPETGLEEHLSCRKVARVLGDAGFTVELGIGGMPTALSGRYGTGDLVIGLCAEYDALPDIGHACGHNVNGAASVGAAIGLASVADELGLTVRLIGTPAEETTGGKIQLLEAGVFDDVSAAMMVHASGSDEVGSSSFALSVWDVKYTGHEAHAATAPWQGINAADAVVMAYQAVALLRQQLPPDQVVSIVILGAGTAPNIIPAQAHAVVELRARTRESLLGLQAAVRRCLQAAELATGARLELGARGNDFAELRQDEFMTRAYAEAMSSLGRTAGNLEGVPVASTDMGNISHVIPSIQPMIGYDVAGAAHHTARFAEHGTSASADLAVLDGARGMALVGAALALDHEQRNELHERRNRRMPLVSK